MNVTEPFGIISHVSNNCINLWGRTKKDIIDKPVEDLMPYFLVKYH
jgi:hypothetical protein